MYIACDQKIAFLFHCSPFEETLRAVLKQSSILNYYVKNDQENDHGHLQEKVGTGVSLPRTFSLSWPQNLRLFIETKEGDLPLLFEECSQF